MSQSGGQGRVVINFDLDVLRHPGHLDDATLLGKAFGIADRQDVGTVRVAMAA